MIKRWKHGNSKDKKAISGNITRSQYSNAAHAYGIKKFFTHIYQVLYCLRVVYIFPPTKKREKKLLLLHFITVSFW